MMANVFGPVPSRRLGRSLGLDLVPFKTCSYDCIYCQLGHTTNKTIERKAWVSRGSLLEELRRKLETEPDYLTLSGSGEPTLFSGIGELIEAIKDLTSIPIAVLTNGSLLWQPALRRELMDADLVIPSLDAGNPAMFERINQPHPGIEFERMLQGLIDFRGEFEGAYWLEIFLLDGVNDLDGEVRDLVECVQRIKPHRVQLNTATRPTADATAHRVEPSRLEQISRLFEPQAEVIADYRQVHEGSAFKLGREAVLEMVLRRPCSIEDIASGLAMHQNEVVKYIGELEVRGAVETLRVNDRLFYRGLRP